MINSPVSPTMKMTAWKEPFMSSPLKQQWISKTSIEMEHPVDWLNVKHIGKETHFTSSYSAHRFAIHLPLSGFIKGNYGFLTQIVLNFSTIGQAAITAVALYEGKYLLWINDSLTLHGDHTFTLPSGNSWEIDPGMPFTDNLRAQLVVSFGAPNSEVPEFVFHAVHARFACDEDF